MLKETTTSDREDVFRNLPIPQALRVMILPAVTSQLIVLIYNMADTFYVGQTDNPYMVAGTSLILPVFNITLCLAGLAGIGGGSLISRLLGMRREDEARRVGAFALYLALTVYHPELLPTSLALKIATTRQSIPFSVAVEVISMELAFELLREAGVRLPSPVSATIGIVGGIIIGSAAVDAGLVSPAVVIISALTGICSFVIPNISVVSGLRLSKYLVIFLSSALGLYGFWAGILLLVVHLVRHTMCIRLDFII